MFISIIQCSICRKDIYPDANFILTPRQSCLHNRFLCIINTCKCYHTTIIITSIFQFIAIRFICLAKTLIIGARHNDVHIIIPGNKPLMADGTKHRAIQQ